MLKKFSPVALPLVLAACQTAQTDILADMSALTSAANPTVSIRNVGARLVVTEYTHRQPVDPKPWRSLNQGRAPATGGGS